MEDSNKAIQGLLGLLAVCLLVIFILTTRSCQREVRNTNLVNALTDSLQKSQNSKGETVGTISTIQTDNVADFLAIRAKDREIQRLQELVREYRRRMTAGSSAGIVSVTGGADVLVPTVVVKTDSIYPTYESTFNLDGWVWGIVSASKDSTTIGLRYKEDISFVIGRERKGLLGKETYFSDVIVHNPFSNLQSYRTYQVSVPNHKWAVGPVLGVGVGPTGFVPFVGVGIQRAVIRF